MVEALTALIHNDVLIVAICAWLIAQICKFLLDAAINRKFSIARLFGDGGMPSGHSATVMACAILVGYTCGWGSPEFALSAILAIVVMHDAMGVRRETGKQAIVLLEMFTAINDLLGEKDKLQRHEKLKTFVGHTPSQVFFGAILGIIVGVVYILAFIPK